MIAEFKIRIPLTKWEDTPVIACFACDNGGLYQVATEQAIDKAIEIADAVEREVRWNFQGSPQGHYVGSRYRLKTTSI